MQNNGNLYDPAGEAGQRLQMAIILGCPMCRAAFEQALSAHMAWDCIMHGTVTFSPGGMIMQLREQLSYWSERAPKPRQVEAITNPDRPHIVCLCGSTRFWKQFQEASLRRTLAGEIVLSVGAAVASDEEHFGHLPEDEKIDIKRRLDALHMRKIELADEVLVLNLDGYVGESTRAEIFYARSLGVPVTFLERACRVCFCTYEHPCHTPVSENPLDTSPCYFVSADLCSACESLIEGEVTG